MKPQEIYIKADWIEATHISTKIVNHSVKDYIKPLTAYVFTPEELEKLAGDIWDAAELRTKQSAPNRDGYPLTAPDKQTYLSKLKQEE